MEFKLLFFTYGLIFSLSALATVYGIGLQLMIAVIIGVFIGGTPILLLLVASLNKSLDQRSTRLEDFITRWINPRIIYSTENPLHLRIIKECLDVVVVKDKCSCCGEKSNKLKTDPFNKVNHRDGCKIPFYAYVYYRDSKTEPNKNKGSVAVVHKPNKKRRSIVKEMLDEG